MRRARAARLGELKRPSGSIPWLSDNGSIYTALAALITAERVHLVALTTLAASPRARGTPEAFVNNAHRDYVVGADLPTAAAVLAQIPPGIANFDAVAPHSVLGFQSQQYRRTLVAVRQNGQLKRLAALEAAGRAYCATPDTWLYLSQRNGRLINGNGNSKRPSSTALDLSQNIRRLESKLTPNREKTANRRSGRD